MRTCTVTLSLARALHTRHHLQDLLYETPLILEHASDPRLLPTAALPASTDTAPARPAAGGTLRDWVEESAPGAGGGGVLDLSLPQVGVNPADAFVLEVSIIIVIVVLHGDRCVVFQLQIV
jgi:hypothetical protein